jgi:hypothetical protein
MTRDEMIALFLRGAETWNAWALNRLCERKALEEAGEWAAEAGFLARFEGQNEKTKNWIKRSSVDFSYCRFLKPGHKMGGGSPVETINVPGGIFDCFGFMFPAITSFEGVEFHIPIRFFGATFNGPAKFDQVEFNANALFNSVQFHGDTSFDGARFRAHIDFFAAQFHSRSSFYAVKFNAAVSFDSVQFHDSTPLFNEAKFDGPVQFISSKFKRGADFRSMRSEVGFDMSGAEFGRVPDFTQATLHRDPRLDNVTVRRGSIVGPVWREARGKGEHWKLLGIWTIRQRIDRDAPAKFRELKHFAIQGEDHHSELQFHAHEVRTARFVNDWPHQPRFLFGVGYELLSNFGRSILRPAIAWVAAVTIFAAIYLGISADLNGRAPDYASLAPTTDTQPCLAAPAVSDERVRATKV